MPRPDRKATRECARYLLTPALMTRGLLGGAGVWKRKPALRQARAAAMRMANPAFIPRNHMVEAALNAAMERQDFQPFEELLDVGVTPVRGQARSGAVRHARPTRGVRPSDFLRYLASGARSPA